MQAQQPYAYEHALQGITHKALTFQPECILFASFGCLTALNTPQMAANFTPAAADLAALM